ncbi:acyl-CoA dehydrogenase C-terminal domain-containing protein [Desulfothermus naphthae]
MAQQLADRRDVDFVLFEQLKVQELSEKYEKYADFNKKTIELILKEARNLAINEILPTNKIGDDVGVKLEDGKVYVPEEFHKVYELLKEGEWIGMAESPEWGGQGMPRSVAMAADNYFIGANPSFQIYMGLTVGAGHLIEAFGTDEQKKLFLKKLYTGEWAGTMLLTEPQAGSDVGALTTTAVKNDDGTYSITGNKIFITGGDQNFTENIIHPVLARIEGAPPGTDGISLFIVPKYWVNEDGSLGEFNDIVCTGIEEKMGLHGSATCSLALGGKGKCRGLLLGQENKGMREMFLMMNQARLLVGSQGAAMASASYLEAVNYARERIQGRHLKNLRDKSAPAVPIIQHPDVRRMLMYMKVYVEALRSLLWYVGLLEDLKRVTESEEEKEKYQNIIDVLIPICKGYGSDRSYEVTNWGVQVFGGYGYTKEYPMEQFVRDCRITMIYEGTNGIQAMDLLGRKLGLKKGKAFMDVMGEIQKTVAEAKAIDALKPFAEELEKALNKLGEVAQTIGGKAMSAEILTAFAHAYPFMEVVGDVVMAWMLLWRAVVAVKALEKAKKKDIAFYNGQIKNIEYFIYSILPITMGKMNMILNMKDTVASIDEDSFGGK